MVCEYCGKQILDNSDTCTGCGAPIPQPVAQPKPQVKSKHEFLIKIILIIVTISVIFIVDHSKKDPLSVAKYDTPVTQVAQTKADFIAECQNYTYDQVLRDPDTYKLSPAHFKGEVSQIIKNDNYDIYMIKVTLDSDGDYNDPICVQYTLPKGASRILEDDVVDIYGTMAGLQTYTSVLDTQKSVPAMSAQYIDLAQ